MLDLIHTLCQPAPCAGRLLAACWPANENAAALSELAAALGCEAVAVCPDAQAAQAAAAAGLKAVTGSLLSDIEGTHFQFSLALVPGPAVRAACPEEDFPEWDYVRRVGPYLRAGGILAFSAAAQQLADHPRVLAALLAAYRELRLYRLTNDETLVIGIRRAERAQPDAGAVRSLAEALSEKKWAAAPDAPVYPLPDIAARGRAPVLRSRQLDPEALARFAAGLPWGEKRLRSALAGWELPPLLPALPLRAMHLGAAISSGVIGSLRVRSARSGQLHVLRGRTVRRVRLESNDFHAADNFQVADSFHVADNFIVADQQTGDFTAEISVLNLADGSLAQVDPQHPGEMQAFLDAFGAPLAQAAGDQYAPRYDPLVRPYPELLEPVLVRTLEEPLWAYGGPAAHLSGGELPGLSSRQRHFAAAAFLQLLGRQAVRPEHRAGVLPGTGRLLLSGQTAVGKTLISHRLQLGLQAVHARAAGRRPGMTGWPLSMYVATPANLPHVLRELRLAAPLFEARHVRCRAELFSALDEAAGSPRPVMLVVSRSLLRGLPKTIPAYRPARAWETLHSGDGQPVICCPTCGAQIGLSRQEAEGWPEDAFLGSGTRVRSRGRKCSACGGALYQQVHGGGDSLALTLRRELRRRRLRLLSLVIDEAHEDANLSNQGIAMGWLADLARYVIGMSGTVYGGAPQSVFYLLFRLFPAFRREWAFGEAERFARRYGCWRQRRRGDGRWGSRVSLPGISPELIAGVFLNYGAFLTQQDAGLPMPERRDLPLEIAPSAAEREGLQLAAEEFRRALQRRRMRDGHGRAAQLLYAAAAGLHLSALSPYSPAFRCGTCGRAKVGTSEPCRHYWPRSEDALEQLDPEAREDALSRWAEPVLDPDWRSSKERALIEIVRQERAEGRPALVYVYHTGRYGLDQRVHTVLEGAGLRACSLAGVAPAELAAAVRKAVYRGADALIANPARIGTGLNLTAAPTVIWYQPVWSPRLMIQASARPDRPTQDRPVRVLYPVLAGSAEQVVLARVMEKIVSIYLLAGIDYEGLSAVMESVGHRESFTEAMIRYVSGQVPSDLSALFEQLAGLEAGRTDRFQAAAAWAVRQVREPASAFDLSAAEQLRLL